MSNNVNLGDVLTVGQAAKEYNYTSAWIYKLIGRNKIVSFNLGGDDGPLVITRASMEEYVQNEARKKENATPTSASR